MKTFLDSSNNTWTRNFHKKISESKVNMLVFWVVLSWVYALCSQVAIPFPFSMVPLSLQPLPLLLSSMLFGWHAVAAYGFYLAQGAMGAPFFAGLNGGLPRLMGPTGGYLFGFALAMIFLVLVTFRKLSFFVPTEKLLWFGLYPFIFGDFVVKSALIIFLERRIKRSFK
jgi:biotin transporter BioY